MREFVERGRRDLAHVPGGSREDVRQRGGRYVGDRAGSHWCQPHEGIPEQGHSQGAQLIVTSL